MYHQQNQIMIDNLLTNEIRHRDSKTQANDLKINWTGMSQQTASALAWKLKVWFKIGAILYTPGYLSSVVHTNKRTTYVPDTAGIFKWREKTPINTATHYALLEVFLLTLDHSNRSVYMTLGIKPWTDRYFKTNYMSTIRNAVWWLAVESHMGNHNNTYLF